MESNPPRVQAHIVGYLGDGCTTLAGIIQQRDGNTITMLSGTSRGTACRAPTVDQVDLVVMESNPPRVQG
ncbi:hypothetical protein [Chloroflexus aggregans]|nr:hypothetical protein [Chloroflexus aggregans]